MTARVTSQFVNSTTVEDRNGVWMRVTLKDHGPDTVERWEVRMNGVIVYYGMSENDAVDLFNMLDETLRLSGTVIPLVR